MTCDPHRDGLVQSVGAPLEKAMGAVILLHGRGGSAEDILSIAQDLYLPGLNFLAPQAAGHSWYPNSFLAPRDQNEPWLTSALAKVAWVLRTIQAAGISAERVVVCGFSQGACLASEFVATHPRRYAGVIAFTGGLIGPPDANLDHTGDLAGTPALFASGDPDPHVPWQRVQRSADIFAKMGALVSTRRYPGRAHTVSAEELDLAGQLVREAFAKTI